jgi:hypothetical protein
VWWVVYKIAAFAGVGAGFVDPRVKPEDDGVIGTASVVQPHQLGHVGTVFIDLQPGGMNAMGGHVFVHVLAVAGNTDCANHFTRVVADQASAAFGKYLFLRRVIDEFHEIRAFLRAHLDEA